MDSDLEAIAQLEERLRQAMISSDVSALDELIADELVFTLPTGALAGKQMDLDAQRSGSEKLTAVNFLERQVQIYGSVAIVTVKTELAGTCEGEDITGIYRYTRIWAQPQGRWQIVAGHVSRVLGGGGGWGVGGRQEGMSRSLGLHPIGRRRRLSGRQQQWQT